VAATQRAGQLKLKKLAAQEQSWERRWRSRDSRTGGQQDKRATWRCADRGVWRLVSTGQRDNTSVAEQSHREGGAGRPHTAPEGNASRQITARLIQTRVIGALGASRGIHPHRLSSDLGAGGQVAESWTPLSRGHRCFESKTTSQQGLRCSETGTPLGSLPPP
jgi:hypothetical protein